MFKKFFLGLLFVIAAFAGYIALQPSEFVLKRESVISAPPAAVFAQVNDFHNWQKWSPWAKLDPDAKATFEGPASGQGARFAWDGNGNVGQGRMTIAESVPNDKIHLQLEFFKPMAGTAETYFTFKPEGDGTRMTWEMHGRNNFIGRVFCFFMNMNDMLGGMFDQGMANINAIVKAK